MKDYIHNKIIKISIFVSMLLLTISTLFVMFNFIKYSSNILNITKFISLNKLFILICIILIFLFVIIYVTSEFPFFYKINKCKLLFYSSLFFCIGVTLLAIFLTHGEAIKTVLFADINDTFMDFYNSIQYGFKPYSKQVIYPPLINIFYGLLGKFVNIGFGDRTLLRTTQAGLFVYTIYLFIVYIPLITLLLKVKKGNIQEKLIFTFSILLSLPFLYALERANSVVLALIFMLIYIRGYQSSDKIKKFGSFISLGIAASIKISPALLGFLLVKERRWKDACVCAGIGILIFMLPFIFTDGNLFILLKNIAKTTAEFQGFAVDNNGFTLIIGQGVYVNILNTGKFLTRYLNFDLTSLANVVNVLVFILGLCFVCLNKTMERWRATGILCGIMILCTGFSVIYNLIYITIPLVLFFDEHNFKGKFDLFYSSLFLGMFIPFVNFKLPQFSRFFTDVYPMRLTTLMESLCLLLFVVCLIIKCGWQIINDSSLFNSTKQKRLFNTGVCLIIIGALFWGFKTKSLESFTPIANGVANASEDFYMKDGLYGPIGTTATIKLLSNPLKDKGLLFSYSIKNDALRKNDSVYKIQLWVNEMLLKTDKIIIGGNYYMYINPQILEENGIFKNNNMMVKIIQSASKDDGLSVNYLGPAKITNILDTATDANHSMAGLMKNAKGQVQLINKGSVLLESNDMLFNGLNIIFSVPEELGREKQANNAYLLLFANGREIRKVIIDGSGNYNINILPKDIFTDQDYIYNNPIEISLELINPNKSNQNINQKNITIQYIGPTKRFEEFGSEADLCSINGPLLKDGNYFWMSNSVSLPFYLSLSKGTGLDVIYKVASDWYKANPNESLVVNLFAGSLPLVSQVKPLVKRDCLRYLHIKPENFSQCLDLDNLILTVNKTFSYHAAPVSEFPKAPKHLC